MSVSSQKQAEYGMVKSYILKLGKQYLCTTSFMNRCENKLSIYVFIYIMQLNSV